MCLWIVTACLGLLPWNPSPIAVPTAVTTLITAPPTTTTTTTPAPTTTKAPSLILNPVMSGNVVPLVICYQPEIVCALNPYDLSGKSVPFESRVATTLPPSAINLPLITGYSAQVPSFNTAVKFPRFRRSLSRKYVKKEIYFWNNIKKTPEEHRIIKQQICACVPSGTCTSNNKTEGASVGCSAGQEYCCGDSVDVAANISCGVLQTARPSSTNSGLIRGSFGENPWQGALLTQRDYVSGTVLIDAFHVLTVSHKVLPYSTPGTTINLKVRMGVWNTTLFDPSLYQEYSVTKVFSHPKFIFTTMQNNIAVLRLASAVPITTSAGAAVAINRVCLPPTTSTVYTGQRCAVSGWGNEEFGPSGSIQTAIKMMEVSIMDPMNCQRQLRLTWLGPNFTLDSTSFICAGGKTDIDACTGGGGSSLVCEVDGKWILVGLLSWGCGSSNAPGVYVNVASFVPWIMQQIASS